MESKGTLRRSSRPGDSTPYIIERYSGTQTNLGGDVFCSPAGGAETNGEMGIVQTTSTKSDEPAAPMHWHEDEHDTLICIRGRLKVWADGECRTLLPGDLASIPPGIEHTYQPVGQRTEIIGLIDTGGWEEFFFECGEAHDGPPYAEKIEIDQEKFGKAADEYGIHVVEEDLAEPDNEATDRDLPGEQSPYFLESGYGQQYNLGGLLATALVTEAESDGSFGIVTYEGSNGAGLPSQEHDDAAKVIYVMEGEISGELDGTEYTAMAGEFVNVPPGTSFSYSVSDDYARSLAFTSGGSAHRLPEVAGQSWDHSYNPQDDSRIDRAQLKAAAEKIDVTFP